MAKTEPTAKEIRQARAFLRRRDSRIDPRMFAAAAKRNETPFGPLFDQVQEEHDARQ